MTQTLEGALKTASRFQRKSQNLADHIAGLIDRNSNLRHEVEKLEDLLAWIHRTEQPIEEIRATIARTIPRRLGR